MIGLLGRDPYDPINPRSAGGLVLSLRGTLWFRRVLIQSRMSGAELCPGGIYHRNTSHIPILTQKKVPAEGRDRG